MKNVLIASPQLYSSITAKLFEEESKWRVSYILTNYSNKEFVEKHFPKAIKHDQLDAVKGKVVKELNDYCFFPEYNHALEDSLLNSLVMLDRNDSNSNSFSLKQRLIFCRDIASYWHYVLKKLDINLVIFEEEPHQSSLYILYKIAKFLSVEVRMVIRTIAELGVIPSTGFENQNPILISNYHKNIKKYHQTNELNLERKLTSYFSNLSGEYDEVLKAHLWDQLETFEELYVKNEKSKVYRKLFSSGIKKLLRFRNNIISLSFQSDQKVKGKSLQDSQLNYVKFLLYKLKTINKKKKLLEIYKRLSVEFQRGDNQYVVCALQYQPEKSTCPLGGVYNDQIVMIKQIREAIPLNITIYVKEHPSQFIYDYARYGEFYRSKEYYMEILRIPNTKLVNMDTNIFELIDNSLFVASVTGTICWEAVNRRKPALCFGKSWMQGCEGIFQIDNYDDLIVSVKKILKKEYELNLPLVLLFGKTIHELNFQMAVGGKNQLTQRGISETENAELFKKALESL